MSNDEHLFTTPTTQFDDLSRSETIATEADNLTLDVDEGPVDSIPDCTTGRSANPDLLNDVIIAGVSSSPTPDMEIDELSSQLLDDTGGGESANVITINDPNYVTVHISALDRTQTML